MKSVLRHLLPVLAILAFPTTSQACRPFGSYVFVEDKDGGIWFTEGDNNAVSRLAPDGTVKVYPVPTPQAEPVSIALDRKGNVWFVESNAAKIGRIDNGGRIAEYPVTGGRPMVVVTDSKGSAWITQMGGSHSHSGGEGHGAHSRSKVARIAADGKTIDYPLTEGWPTSIIIDSRDQVWVTVLVPGVGSSKPRGLLTRLQNGKWVTVAEWQNSCPRNLIAAPGGEIIMADGCKNVVMHVFADGRTTEHPLPPKTAILHMTQATDGTLWFTDREHLAKLDKNGTVTYVERPANGDRTFAVLEMRSGDIIFSEAYNYNINRLKKSGGFVEHLVGERRGSREVKDGEVCYVQFGARIAAKAEMDRKRAEEVKSGRFKPDGAGTEKLVEQKCLACHDARRLLLSRRSDWTPSITRMHAYRDIRNVEPLTAEETKKLVRYFNENYGLNQ